MAKKVAQPSWAHIKANLTKENKTELIKLLRDLYALGKDNKAFILSRYALGAPLDYYKNVIEGALYPDIGRNAPIRLSVGRKAISDYNKATGDKIGVIELMVFYLECGNRFTVDFGDIDEDFHSSLETMMDRILKALAKQPQDVQDQYIPRLDDVVTSAGDIGWGYYDALDDMFREQYPE